jgi:DNA primase
MQTAFGLGFSNKYPDDLYQFLQKKGYQTDAILQAGLIQVDERNGVYDKFWNRVMFPIMDVNHRVVGFGGRVMGDAKPKYLNSPETLIFNKSRTLYGLNRARTSKQSYFLLCEGYMDVIALHQAGYSNAVASLGTAFTSGHASMIKRYVQEVYLTYDSDEAGVKAALRAIPILRQEGILAKVIRLAPYKDPDEFLAKEGQEAFEQRIREARNGFLFSMDQLAKQFDFDSPEGKTAFFQACARRLIEFEDELERGNYLEAIAKHYKVSPESLQKLVTKTAISQGMATPTVQAKTASKPVKRRESAIVTSQKFLLTWMLDNDKIFAVVKKYITPKDFTEPLYQTVARLLYEQYDAGQLNPAKILNHFTEEEEHEEAASLFHTTLKELTTKEEKEQALRETLLRVKKHSLEEQTMHLDPADMAGLQRMMEEKRVLEEIKRLHISIE